MKIFRAVARNSGGIEKSIRMECVQFRAMAEPGLSSDNALINPREEPTPFTAPRLYERYDRRQVIQFFGSEEQAQQLCDGHWLIFPEHVVCLASVGAPLGASHFANGGTFCWVADKPYRVHEGRCNHFVPAQVIGSEGNARSIWLFVRPERSAEYWYVGKLGPSYMQQAPGRQNHGMARFDLRPTLPSGVWRQLGGLRTGDMDCISVDRALDRLHEPTTVEERLHVLKRLVEYWHGPIGPEDGYPQAEIASQRLPRPLGWWYEWAGRRKDIMSGQNILLGPTKESGHWTVKEEEGHLLFYLENQAVYRWATHFEGDDPPVFGRYAKDEPWELEGMTLSEHLILACILESVMCHSPYGAAAACIDPQMLSRITGVITPISIGPWRWLGPTQFYARNGAFMYSMSNGTDRYSVWLGAKTEEPLQFMKPLLGDQWEYRAV